MVASTCKSALVAGLVLAAGGGRIKRRAPRALEHCGIKGESAPSSQIVNGQPATECEWRWQASLRRGSPFCGGTLITPEWVLTAAHCVDAPNFDVRLGGYNTSASSSKQQTRRAVKVFQHPEYKDLGYLNDYAMVKLDSPVTIDECVGTACLPVAGADVAAGSRCWITGWGTLKSNGMPSQILQEAEVSIIGNEDCVNNFGYHGSQITDAMICAQGRTEDGLIRDACQGDSGGPLVCESAGRWTLYGATSWGRGCAGENFPGVWARVHEQLSWIEDILDGWEPAPTTTPSPDCPSYCSMSGFCSIRICSDFCSFC